MKKSSTFHDFGVLIHNGGQKFLSYGEYCNKVGNERNNRKKLIYYNYKRLKSSL